MNLAVDLDDSAIDLISQLVVFHNETYGTHLSKWDFTTYFYEEVWGGTSEEAIAKVDQFAKSNYFRNIVPIPDSQETLRRLSKKHKLFLVTGRRKPLREATFTCINEFFPNIFEEVYFTNSFSTNGDRILKSEVCKKLDARLIIDDDMMHIVDCAGAGIPVLVFSQPWNQGTLPQKAVRLFSWKEIADVIENFVF